MELNLYSLAEGAGSARGVTVIIDVFRAFTCTPLLFSLGIKDSMLVSTAEEAFALKRENPERILVGEIGGIPIEGFDVGNSPSQILRLGREYFAGKSVVQRTSAGVQGALIASENAEEVLLGSFTVAKPTTDYIRRKSPERVSLVAMGWQLKDIAPEDEWCARYMAHLLGKGDYDHNQAMREVIFHESAQKFLRGNKAYFPPEDPVLCLQRDLYDFALRAEKVGGNLVVSTIENSG